MPDSIRLRGVRVHNLKSIDIDLPKRKLIGFCGPSGSGKSSLAINTLLAEGQRKYLETFSVSERGKIDLPEKPDVDEIEGVPPAIAISRSIDRYSDRSTVGSITDLVSYYRTLVVRYGHLVCPSCKLIVQEHSPDSCMRFLEESFSPGLEDKTILIGFPVDSFLFSTEQRQELVSRGFQRVLLDNSISRIENVASGSEDFSRVIVLVDRVRFSESTKDRILESFETAGLAGDGNWCAILSKSVAGEIGEQVEIDSVDHSIVRFSKTPTCDGCQKVFHRLSPMELSWNSPAGACPVCEGIGRSERFVFERLVADTSKSIADGALKIRPDDEFAPVFQFLRSDLGDLMDLPLLEWRGESKAFENKLLGALDSYYQSSKKNSLKRKLASYRGEVTCCSCQGTRLNEQALANHYSDWNLATLSTLSLDTLLERMQTGEERHIQGKDRYLYHEIESRLRYLNQVGLGYLTLDRRLDELSMGERQRVAMTNALGSNLVNMLYLLDEPSAGLHPADLPGVSRALRDLVDRGNTVIAVDHEVDVIKDCDQVAEFGPGAGIYGGELIYSGQGNGLLQLENSPTGGFISGQKFLPLSVTKKPKPRHWLKLAGAEGHNLKNVSVDFPLNQLCVVTGVSGSGKTSLVLETLYPAVRQLLTNEFHAGLKFDSLSGHELIDDVVLIDHELPITSSRSNPATYCKAFDAIRNVFAETVDARAKNYKAGQFSFNTDGGRCDACKGEGLKQIDMKFMSNLHVRCKFCKGTRFKQETLSCRYRGLNIAEVLAMTVKEAFPFFRGQKKVQAKLKPLLDVGLDYLSLGQPTSTLSTGEIQRLRLAGFLAVGRKTRTLFIMDEPSVGMHFVDLERLLDCFNALVAEGHSLVLVENNRMMMAAADYIIDLGPDAGEKGGEIVVAGTPEVVARSNQSKTGKIIKKQMMSE